MLLKLIAEDFLAIFLVISLSLLLLNCLCIALESRKRSKAPRQWDLVATV